jgi:quinol monooxygenase YgiN
MSQFAFIAHMRAKPGKRQELMDMNIEMMRVTHEEPGVPIYAFNTEEANPDDFWYYDLYESQEAYDAHCATAEYQNLMANLANVADVIFATKLIPFGPTKSVPVQRP